MVRNDLRGTLTISIDKVKEQEEDLKKAEEEIDKHLVKLQDTKAPPVAWWYYTSGENTLPLNPKENFKVEMAYIENQETGSKPKKDLEVEVNDKSYHLKLDKAQENTADLVPKDDKTTGSGVKLTRKMDEISAHPHYGHSIV